MAPMRARPTMSTSRAKKSWEMRAMGQGIAIAGSTKIKDTCLALGQTELAFKAGYANLRPRSPKSDFPRKDETDSASAWRQSEHVRQARSGAVWNDNAGGNRCAHGRAGRRAGRLTG